ncbi:MAG: toll/interleukin-1 receptor domain-containing protein [Beijerinckiaceae bacterium]|nr:toll/interleukin-1 receptor domain-containing protein [Beijerinckiaceae bacterium]MCI0735078.1 toll/interleukin-1 receptor domain-containing protein [Beijerinckiaceae bacterium]
MKVFISWSGERSQIFAQELHEWLPMVLQSIVPWLSQADIEAGERWAEKIAKELESCNFGILSVTRENIGSPWILFEAGALAKRMQEGHVIPLLLDVDFKDVTGPLAQFQAKKMERDGLFDVVKSINRLSDFKVSDTQLPKQFDALWPNFEKRIGGIPTHPTSAKQHRPQQEILEELVSSIRGLDLRFQETVEGPPEMRRRRRRFHPMMMQDFIFGSERFGFGPRDPLRFLLIASFVKDDLPWLYELAADAYRETVSESPRAKVAQQRMVAVFKALQRRPSMEMFESKEMHMVVHELLHYVDGVFAESGPSLGEVFGDALKARDTEVSKTARGKSEKPDEE